MRKILCKSCIILLSIFLLFGCSNKGVESKNTVSNSKSSAITANTDKKTSKEIESEGTNSVSSEEKSEPENTNKQILIKSEKLGFNFTLPENWASKYTIEEDEMGIFVYFKPKEKIQEEEIGFIFAIINKKSKDLNEDMFDSVCEKRYFKTKNATYFIGGPTDINFPPDNPEFKTYSKLKSQVPEVIKTLKENE